MKSRVLYFPYMRVPESAWLTQMLLYWDQVSSIVPYEYIQSPESLGPFMLDLVREEVVHQVTPGVYIHEIPRFRERFLGYLEGLGAEMDRRRSDFTRRKVCRIHIEKMGPIGDALVQLQLATLGHYPWYDVENDTADDFMSYLATALGQLESIDSAPVTDSRAYLQRLACAGVAEHQLAQQLESLRIQVLDGILPMPTQSIEASKLRAFKEKHGAQLRDFRLRVERELVTAANLTDPALRQRQLDIFFDEAAARIEEIQDSMRSAGWDVAKSALAVVATIPGVSPLLGLLAAVWDVVTKSGEPRDSRDFAYAAYASAEFARAV